MVYDDPNTGDDEEEEEEEEEEALEGERAPKKSKADPRGQDLHSLVVVTRTVPSGQFETGEQGAVDVRLDSVPTGHAAQIRG